MRNIETFPSKQMYPYLSLDERKVAEFYHNIDRRRWLVWLKWLIFINFSGQLMVSLQWEEEQDESVPGEGKGGIVELVFAGKTSTSVIVPEVEPPVIITPV